MNMTAPAPFEITTDFLTPSIPRLNNSKYCTPVIKKHVVYVPSPAPKCSDPIYNITTNDEFKAILQNGRIPLGMDPDFLYGCIANKMAENDNTQIQTDMVDINTKISNYTTQKGLIDTYNEMNNSSLYYYNNDLKYVIYKISFFIILLFTYIYFFKLTGIIEPIKNLFNKVIKKGNDFINKESDKIKNPKPTNANPKPTNANPKPTNANPKPTNTNPKPVNSNPKPIIQKSTNSK